MKNEFRWLSAGALRDLVATRSASPLEIVQACLATIGELDPVLRAFITVGADRAIDQARSANGEAVTKGASLGPLHGVPVALKDEAWTFDMPSTAGSLIFKRFVPSRDGTVAERLRRAGAIIIGKTNMPEFAAWPRSKNQIAGESGKPVGCQADLRGIEWRIGGGRGCRDGAAGGWLGRRRFDTDPLRALRCSRSVPESRTRPQLRQLQLHTCREHGSHRTRGRRCGSHAARHRWPRSARCGCDDRAGPEDFFLGWIPESKDSGSSGQVTSAEFQSMPGWRRWRQKPSTPSRAPTCRSMRRRRCSSTRGGRRSRPRPIRTP